MRTSKDTRSSTSWRTRGPREEKGRRGGKTGSKRFKNAVAQAPGPLKQRVPGEEVVKRTAPGRHSHATILSAQIETRSAASVGVFKGLSTIVIPHAIKCWGSMTSRPLHGEVPVWQSPFRDHLCGMNSFGKWASSCFLRQNEQSLHRLKCNTEDFSILLSFFLSSNLTSSQPLLKQSRPGRHHSFVRRGRSGASGGNF